MKVFILYFTRSYSQCALFILMYHRAWKIDLYIPIFFFLFLFWQWWYLPLLLHVKVISLVFFNLLFQVIGYVWLLLHNIKQKLTSQTTKLDCEILWLNWTALEIWSKSNQGFVKGSLFAAIMSRVLQKWCHFFCIWHLCFYTMALC